MILEMVICSLSPRRAVENQSACRYLGLKAESVSGATHFRVEGCGRKGLTSHWGFLTEPLGGFRERWQRVPAGSEERGVGHMHTLFLYKHITDAHFEKGSLI